MATKPVLWNGTDSQGNPLRWGTPKLTWDGDIPQLPIPSKRMHHLRVRLSFSSAADHVVKETADSVSANLFGNAAYPSPPVTKAALDAANAAFSAAITAQATGGAAATADKKNKRDTLVGLLRQLAGYVQINHHDDLAILLSSGFEAVGANVTHTVLTAPTITDIVNGNSGQLILSVAVIKGVRMWKVRYAAIGAGGAPGPWQDGGLHSDSRHLDVGGLTPGTNDTFEVQAIVTGKKQSDWSHAVSHMSL